MIEQCKYCGKYFDTFEPCEFCSKKCYDKEKENDIKGKKNIKG